MVDKSGEVVTRLVEELEGLELLNVFFKLGVFLSAEANVDTLDIGDSAKGILMKVEFSGMPDGGVV
ncbi:MAG: hypothetical protein ACTSPB_00315 [Candidatus Thorarchaeota archaeon]